MNLQNLWDINGNVFFLNIKAMDYSTDNGLDETMKYVINMRKDEINKEKLAEMINSLEDLSLFHSTMPDP